MPTRRYFTKAHNLDKSARVPKATLPNYVVLQTPTGISRKIGGRFVAQKAGNSRGGLKTQALGLAHRWTSEEARKVALKTWRTRWRMNGHIKARIGRPRKNRPAVKRGPLRAYYAAHPTNGVTYVNGVWTVTTVHGTRPLSEKAALTRLGHLGKRHLCLLNNQGEVALAQMLQSSDSERT